MWWQRGRLLTLPGNWNKVSVSLCCPQGWKETVLQQKIQTNHLFQDFVKDFLSFTATSDKQVQFKRQIFVSGPQLLLSHSWLRFCFRFCSAKFHRPLSSTGLMHAGYFYNLCILLISWWLHVLISTAVSASGQSDDSSVLGRGGNRLVRRLWTWHIFQPSRSSSTLFIHSQIINVKSHFVCEVVNASWTVCRNPRLAAAFEELAHTGL